MLISAANYTQPHSLVTCKQTLLTPSGSKLNYRKYFSVRIIMFLIGRFLRTMFT